MTLYDQFGDIDIYLFDQILRGRILPGMRILDAGCGVGRNLVYFLQNQFDVCGVDEAPPAVEEVLRLASILNPVLPRSNFRLEAVESISFPDSSFDVVLSSAVLHFAKDEAHFGAMLNAMWRVLRPGGLFFCRLASSVALKHKVVKGRRRLSPDGVERFLVDERYLMKKTAELAGDLLDPLKTTVIQDLRCMTTWVVRKRTNQRLVGIGQ